MASMRCVFALLFVLSAGAARAADAADALIGFWAHEAEFGPRVEGPLVVSREGGTWSATIADRPMPVSVAGKALRFELGDDFSYRGVLRDDGTAIDGYWIRGEVREDPRFPGGMSRPFATAVTLHAAGDDRWQGTVPHHADRFRLYLKVFRDDEGRLLGAFRDPDRNDIGDASRYLVVRDGDAVRFQLPNEAGGFDTAFSATLAGADADATLVLPWYTLGTDITLERRTPDRVRAFFPRPPGEPAYAYREPERLDDGWPVARGAEVGLDEAALAAAVQGIIDVDPAMRGPSLVHSVLVARRGKLVLEEYFHGFDRDTPHDIRSAGKTFSSVLMGTARHRGVAIGPGTRIVEALAARGPFAHPDPRKDAITLAHLMTHAAGLACNDNDDDSPGNENTMDAQRAQPDWWKYALDLPMAHDPGTRYAYCSANIHLVAGALTAATGTWLPEFFDRSLARPLGFGEWHWYLTPQHEGYLGGGAYLRPRDLLKVGQLFLDGGTWRGERLLAADWVAESTAPRIAITPETTGYSEEDFGNYYGRGEDGYAWHLGTLRVGERDYRTYSAGGNGGQILLVAPELELTLVFTGGNYRQGGIWGQWPQRIVGPVLAAKGTTLP